VSLRDYRDSTSAGRARGRPQRKRGGLLYGLLAGALLGLVAAGVLVWYLMPRAGDFRTVETAPVLRPPPVALTTPAQPAAPAAPSPTTAGPGGNPNYTFYDILPGNQAPKPRPPAQARDAWWLQVAALKSEPEAGALRARLILLGLDAVVQPVQTGGDTFHRIRVGPFASEDAARSAGETLRVNNFEARLLKEAVTSRENRP
jgi:cell division protein FtsN